MSYPRIWIPCLCLLSLTACDGAASVGGDAGVSRAPRDAGAAVDAGSAPGVDSGALDGGPPPADAGLLPGRPTLVGLHGTSNPAVARTLGAQAMRFIVADQVIASIEPEARDALVAELAALRAEGVEVILTLRWPVEPGVGPGEGPDLDRVPTGDDRAAALAQVRDLVRAAGPHLAWLQVNNEPVGGPGVYADEDITPGADGTIAAIAWMGEVARVIDEERRAAPELSHLRIMSPALTGLRARLGGGGDPLRTDLIEAIIDLAEARCDALDVHMHVESVQQVRDYVGWVRERTATRLTATEWSQAKSSRDWLREERAPRFGTGPNVGFILDAYESPVSAEVWRDFVSTAPFTPGFLADSYAVMREEGFAHACYGGAFQYGNPLFDLKALYANRTVAERRAPNQPFHAEYVALTGAR